MIGLSTATALVVGTVIGSSIFVQASEITSLVPDPTLVVLAWAVAGVLTLIGALVCAELASAFADAGLVVLLDASLMFVALAGAILGVWCAIAGTTTLGRSSRENAP